VDDPHRREEREDRAQEGQEGPWADVVARDDDVEHEQGDKDLGQRAGAGERRGRGIDRRAREGYITLHDISSNDIARPVDALAGSHQEDIVTSGLLDLGRFAEPSIAILISLSDGPKHGYAIMADAEATTGQPLGPGTLYAALGRLERRGLIEALPAEDRRRPYRLTGLGATTLRAHLDQLERLVQTGLVRLHGFAGTADGS
jgi:DNA-binding PadR family transcriptional regulator